MRKTAAFEAIKGVVMTEGDITLRRFVPEDRLLLAQLAGNTRVSEHMTTALPNPYGLAEADHWITRTRKETAPHNFAIVWRGTLVGGIGAEIFAQELFATAELGYWLGEPYWGQGLATRAVALFVPYAFGQLGVKCLQALVAARHLRSRRVLEKNDFMLEKTWRGPVGLLGLSGDILMYSRYFPEG